jgi:hypothetical protein
MMRYCQTLLLLMMTGVSLAQSRDSVDLKTFLAQIESGTQYHIFYKSSWLDSLKTNAAVDNSSVERTLDRALTGTGLQYTIVKGNLIFITRERPIQTLLPEDFFPADKHQKPRPRKDFDFSAYDIYAKKRHAEEIKTFFIGQETDDLTGNATLAGNIRDITSGEPVIGATVYNEKTQKGVFTDQFGYYSITLPKGKHELKIKSVGMKSTLRQVMLYADGKLNIELYQEITPLKEVVIESDKEERLITTQMGTEKLDIQAMKQIPLALGETDLMKVVLTLPGVQTVGEGTVGLNIRGGATNQNLILLNDAVVYNPSHLFGFFSTFNPDVLKNVELYKSGIKAEYGGRLSSVLDVHTREGNLKKFSGSGGISPITGRLSLEGPIIKDKTSFVIGTRSTYSNWLLRQLKNENLASSKASFYDVTAAITHKINDNNSVYLSGYMSKDHFNLGNDTTYAYSDRNASMKWKHIFNNKFVAVLSGSFSNYTNGMSSEKNPQNAFNMQFSVKQWTSKADFNYFLNSKHTFDWGLSTTRYYLDPGMRAPVGQESQVAKDVVEQENGRENAVYISDNLELSPRVSFYAGLRYSFYQSLGPKSVYSYAGNVPNDPVNVTDTTAYAKGKTIASYQGAEPRVALRYSINSEHSFKVSYNRMRQYIQMLSNTTAITPTDSWKLTDRYIRPQIGDQFSLGFYKNIRGKNLIETSVEAYYKLTPHTIDYKDGAVLLLNHNIETDILDSKGKAYGIEFMAKKNAGKLNGWVSYTYSRSFLKTQSKSGIEKVNDGKYYRSSFDKPHAFNFIGNYKFSRRINFSLNLVYSTGRPITLPILKYRTEGVTRVFYSDRNAFRIPNYFRSDISLNLEGNHKVKKLAHSSWTLAVYNLTGRKNAYSVFFRNENGQLKGYKLSIFAQAIPTITYNFRF